MNLRVRTVQLLLSAMARDRAFSKTRKAVEGEGAEKEAGEAEQSREKETLERLCFHTMYGGRFHTAHQIIDGTAEQKELFLQPLFIYV